MNYLSTETLENIKDLMDNGHWTQAQKDFKAVNITPSEYTDWIQEQEQDVVNDFALLGYYCRDYTPLDESYYK